MSHLFSPALVHGGFSDTPDDGLHAFAAIHPFVFTFDLRSSAQLFHPSPTRAKTKSSSSSMDDIKDAQGQRDTNSGRFRIVSRAVIAMKRFQGEFCRNRGGSMPRCGERYPHLAPCDVAVLLPRCAPFRSFLKPNISLRQAQLGWRPH